MLGRYVDIYRVGQKNQRPDLLNILRLSYDNAEVTIGRLIYKTSYHGRQVFLGTVYLRNRKKIVWDSVRPLAYDIPKRNFSTI